jgi:hypothetical protein
MATQIDICNLALANIRVPAITSFGDGTTQARVCAQSYPEIYTEILGEHRWRFAMKQALLTPLTQPPWPPAGWYQTYQIPGDTILIHTCRGVQQSDGSPMPPSVLPWPTYEDSAIRWDRYGPLLVTMLTPDYSIVLDYVANIAETALPPYYRRYLVACLQKTFAGAITGKAEYIDRAEKDMMVFGMKARLRDSQARTPPRNIPTRLITYR